MVKAIIDIDKETNRILNMVKAEFDLRDKSQAIDKVVKEFGKLVRMEPEVRPSYLRKLKRIEKEPTIRIGGMREFRKRYGLK
jgi:hypothetical protein